MARTRANEFEKAFQQLEKIVQRLESEELPLDESLQLFEEGIGLSRFCNQKLEEGEKKIELVFLDTIRTALGRDGIVVWDMTITGYTAAPFYPEKKPIEVPDVETIAAAPAKKEAAAKKPAAKKAAKPAAKAKKGKG